MKVPSVVQWSSDYSRTEPVTSLSLRDEGARDGHQGDLLQEPLNGPYP